MVNSLIRMKLATLRNSPQSTRIFGLILGLLVALGTILLTMVNQEDPTSSAHLVAMLFGFWMIGWILGPIFTGGDATLRPIYFRLLPISSRRLVPGLFAAAFVGFAPAVSLLAFVSLVVYASRLGVLATVVALPTVLLQLSLVLLLSKVVLGLLGQAMKSWLGTILGALIHAFVMALGYVGWLVVPITGRLEQPSYATSLVFRSLPSGWGLVSVEAASQSNWGLCVGAFLAQVAFVLLLLLAWAWLLEQHDRPGASNQIPFSSATRGQHASRPLSSKTRAVMRKELQIALRNPQRVYFQLWALFIGLFVAFIPLIGEWFWPDTVSLLTLLLPAKEGGAGSFLLPWAGAISIYFAGMASINVYGADAGSLWQTLMMPDAYQHDVRGRQWAWLLLVAPVSLMLTIIFTAISGHYWVWPWVLAFVPALLGGAAGLMMLVSVFTVIPMPEQRSGNPLDARNQVAANEMMGPAMVMMVLLPFTVVPALTVVLTGTLMGSGILQWSGVGVGIATGAFYIWWFGRIAYRRLQLHGPELLELARKGQRMSSPTTPGEKQHVIGGSGHRSPRQMVLAAILWIVPWFPLLHLGIVPLLFEGGGPDFRLLHLPIDNLPQTGRIALYCVVVACCLLCFSFALVFSFKPEKDHQKVFPNRK